MSNGFNKQTDIKATDFPYLRRILIGNCLSLSKQTDKPSHYNWLFL